MEINKIMAPSFHKNPLIIENKTLYGIFECVAKNEFGQANKTFLVQEGFVPSAINSVSYYKIIRLNISSTSLVKDEFREDN